MATCASVVCFCSPPAPLVMQQDLPAPLVMQQLDQKDLVARYCQTVRGSRIDFSSLHLLLRSAAPAAPRRSVQMAKARLSSVRLKAVGRFRTCPEPSPPAQEDRSIACKKEGREMCDRHPNMSAVSTRNPSGSSTPATMALSMSSSASSLPTSDEANEITVCPEGGRWLTGGSSLLQMQLTIVEKERSIEALRKRVEELESSQREESECDHDAYEKILSLTHCETEVDDNGVNSDVGVPDDADLSGDLDAVCLKSEALLREFLALGLGDATDESYPKDLTAEPRRREAGSRSISARRPRRSSRQTSSTTCHSTQVPSKAGQLTPNSTRWR